MLKTSDFERGPCDCGQCRQAGVDKLPQLRDPRSGTFLHGYPLKSLHASKDAFWALVHRKSEERKVNQDK